MTEKQLEKFKKIIYEPYLEAWNIMKELRQADLTKQETWDSYMNKCEAYRSKYTNEMSRSLYRVMLDCGDEAKRITNGL